MEPGVTAEDRFARRVSWTPGAEGAPLAEVGFGVLVERLVVEVGWAGAGTMRSDWWWFGD